MASFRPSRPSRGRLCRLGIVIEADARASAIARLCDRAGIDVVWLADRSKLGTDRLGAPALDVLEEMASAVELISLGLITDGSDALERLAEQPGPLANLLEAGKLEVASVDRPQPASPGAAEVRRGLILNDLDELGSAVFRADDIVLPAWRHADLETAADEVRARTAEAGRDVSSLGVAALLPVSIGRTQAEAEARISGDPVFETVGHPAGVGIFGTLEECQDRVIALAHAGITDLRCLIPATLDVHDVIAQLTAITLGTTDVLIPGSLRSPSPPPPEGWGGRSPVPVRPQISGGSRRR